MDIKTSSGSSPSDHPDEVAPFSSPIPTAGAGEALRSEPIVARCDCRVLVVEDDPMVREINVRVLAQAGYLVTEATDGEEGWAALEREPFHLLVTDHRMPRLTGIDLVCRIRAKGDMLPVILASGTLPSDAEGLAAELAPLTLLEKPFTCDELLSLVQSSARSR